MARLCLAWESTLGANSLPAPAGMATGAFPAPSPEGRRTGVVVVIALGHFVQVTDIGDYEAPRGRDSVAGPIAHPDLAGLFRIGDELHPFRSLVTATVSVALW